MSNRKSGGVRQVIDSIALGQTRILLDRPTGTNPLPGIAWHILRPGQRLLVLCGNAHVARQMESTLRRTHPGAAASEDGKAPPEVSVGPLGSDSDIVVTSWREYSVRLRETPDLHYAFNAVYMGERYPEHDRLARNAAAPFLARSGCLLIEERIDAGMPSILERSQAGRRREADTDQSAHTVAVLARIAVNAAEHRGVEMDEVRRARLAELGESGLSELVLRLTREPGYAFEDEFPQAPRP